MKIISDKKEVIEFKDGTISEFHKIVMRFTKKEIDQNLIGELADRARVNGWMVFSSGYTTNELHVQLRTPIASAYPKRQPIPFKTK